MKFKMFEKVVTAIGTLTVGIGVRVLAGVSSRHPVS
jgi:hypothetical protein